MNLAALLAGLLAGWSGLSPIEATVVSVMALAVYLLPFWVAKRRRHHSVAAVLALNLLLGWTGLFWALALVWALTNPAPGTARRPYRR